MDWDDVRHFLALARAGSVRAAGASLRVSHSTVARRVEALEARLGVKLFDRNRDGYVLSDAGEQMMPTAERIEMDIATLERGVAGKDARLEGRVRVTCTDSVIASILVRTLATLCAQHAGIELELDAEAKNLDLSKREADVAVRAVPLGAFPPEHLLGRRLVPIVVGNYVGKAHAHRLDPDRGGTQARWLGSDRIDAMKDLLRSSSHPDLPVWGTFSSLAVMLEAVREGLGLAMLPTYLGDGDPALERMVKPDLRHVADFWLLSHSDLRDNARLRVVRSLIAEALTACAPLFRGETQPEDGSKAEPRVTNLQQARSDRSR